jgi:hypothetical protein
MKGILIMGRVLNRREEGMQGDYSNLKQMSNDFNRYLREVPMLFFS